jgi:ABC-type nitrate/sulfonate/bicarbonate transport system ATPase subunit
VALARAFSIDPEVLLLDEPFSALDELTARRLRLLLQDLWRSSPPTGLLVTHNMLEAAFLADRVIVLGQKPARIVHEISINVPRPRQPEDPTLFEAHREIMGVLT